MKWSLSWAHRAISRISNWFAVSLYSGEWWFDVDSIYQTLISFNTIFIFRRNFLYSTSNIYDLSLSSLPVAARDIFDGWFIRIECLSAEARRIRFWRENGNSPVYVSAFAGVDFAPMTVPVYRAFFFMTWFMALASKDSIWLPIRISPQRLHFKVSTRARVKQQFSSIIRAIG